MHNASLLQEIDLVRSQPLASLVQKEIERQILTGEVAAGARLNELEIARRLGVSRAPVRECLRTLEEAGLVVIRKNYGVFVRVISNEEAREIYAVRAYIDAGVGVELAQRLKRSDLADLEGRVQKMEAAHGAANTALYHELNVAFHERMVELVGNRKLIEVYRRLLNELVLYRRQSLAQPGAMARSVEEHRGIVAALRSRDAEAAGRLMRTHILASSERLQHAHARASAVHSAQATHEALRRRGSKRSSRSPHPRVGA